MNKKSKIYIAGHNGMVGSAIVRQLTNKGYENIVVCEHKDLDLTNQMEVKEFFYQNLPEYVFMAAAKVGGIKANNDYPVDFLIDNIQIQNNIFRNSFDCKVKKLLFLGSSCIYPKECKQPIKEEYLLSGQLEQTNEPYAIAKISGLKACLYYNRQHGTKYIGVIPANSYGINDSFDLDKSHVIPALIKRFFDAKQHDIDKVVLWGTGAPLREFIYVDDLAEACVFLMNNYNGEEILNVGTNTEISILDLANFIKNITGYEGSIEFDVTKSDGMLRRIVDSSKINALGWKAKIDLEKGLIFTCKHYLEKYS